MSSPFVSEEYLLCAVPTEIAVSPDESYLLCTIQTQDGENNKKLSAIWLIDLSRPNMRPAQYTAGTSRDSQPCWSPDGNFVAFVSDRTGTQQLWVMPAHGGEARQITRMNGGVSHPAWSPDGQTIAFLSSPEDLSSPFQDSSAISKPPVLLNLVTQLQYRWDGGRPNAPRTHCFLLPIANWLQGGELANPYAVTSGDFSHGKLAWSPDSTRIAMISDRTDQRDANMSSDVWVLTIQTKEMRCLTDQQWITDKPCWSPDGNILAWYATGISSNNSISARHIHIAALLPDGDWSPPGNIMEKWDVMVDESINSDTGSVASPPPQWSVDGNWLYTTQASHGMVHLWRYAIDGSAAEQITNGSMQLGGWYVTRDARHVYGIATTPQRLPELAQFCVDCLPASIPEQWLTNCNPWLSQKVVTEPELVTFVTSDGWWIDGWVHLPAAAKSAQNTKLWPAIVLIHGGPHSFFGPIFSLQRQLFVDAGYAVIFINPRGSVGYGEFFARACDGDWGGGDYRDIMEGVDSIISRYPIDANRLAVTGMSYGGYLTNWIIGHTDRFKAAVTINSVSNLVSSFGTSDIDSVLGIRDQQGTPWQKMEHYIRLSPITYADAIITPTRVIGAEEDWRCPIEQSEQIYTAIKHLGQTATDFIRIPGVSHNINKGTPKQRVAQRKAILEWIQRYNPA